MEKLPAIPVALYHSHHKFWKCGSKIFVLTVGLSSKLFFRFFHDVNIGPNQFQLDHLIKKYETRSVITVSNHMSCLDDPMLWGVLLRWQRLAFGWKIVRWVPGAHEICFEGGRFPKLKGLVMSMGKTVSCRRGDGVFQSCMDFCVEKIDSNQPVHIFVEGKVNDTPNLIRTKWGVGRLVVDSKKAPVILPFIHRGMNDVLPLHHNFPKITRQRISIEIGGPIDTSELLLECRRFNLTDIAARKYITDVIEWRLEKIGNRLNKFHFKG